MVTAHLFPSVCLELSRVILNHESTFKGNSVAARGRIIGCAITLILLPFALLVPAHAVPGHSLNRPSWRVGDFWNYTVSVSIPDSTGGPPHNGTGTAMMMVNATETLELGSASFDTYKLTTTTKILLDGIIAERFAFAAWYQRSDLSLLKSTVNFTFGGFDIASEESHQPPLLMQWPVESGGAWTSNSTITINVQAFQAHFIQPASAEFVADKPQRVTVATGTFATLPLQKTLIINGTGFDRGVAFSLYANEMGLLVWRYLSLDNSVTRILSFWSNDVGAPVRQVITGDLGFTASSDLESFRYQAIEGCINHTDQPVIQIGTDKIDLSFFGLISCKPTALSPTTRPPLI